MAMASARGLCGVCTHAREVLSGKGSVFVMCELSKVDARFRKYPPLPVLRCDGFKEQVTSTESDDGL